LIKKSNNYNDYYRFLQENFRQKEMRCQSGHGGKASLADVLPEIDWMMAMTLLYYVLSVWIFTRTQMRKI